MNQSLNDRWLIAITLLGLSVAGTLPAQDSESPRAFTITTSGPTVPVDVKLKAPVIEAAGERGPIHAWDLGDGTQASGPEVEHRYHLAGKYVIQLTTTLAGGKQTTQTSAITIGNSKPYVKVLVNRTQGPAPLVVDFDATGSIDPDGHTLRYRWDFGDGTLGVGAKLQHTFTDQSPSYDVTLSVDDGYGGTETETIGITIDRDNSQPKLITKTLPGTTRMTIRASVENPEKYQRITWDLGDGQWASGPEIEHTYPKPDGYLLRLTTQDQHGEIRQISETVTPNNQPPVALFTFRDVLDDDLKPLSTGTAPLELFLDGRASLDPESEHLEYSWRIGSTVLSGPIARHRFEAPGRHEVTLRVTDDQGLVNERTRWVDVLNARGERLGERLLVPLVPGAILDTRIRYFESTAVHHTLWGFPLYRPTLSPSLALTHGQDSPGIRLAASSYLNIERRGEYRFFLQGGEAELWIGATRVAASKNGEAAEGTIRLTQGFHPIVHSGRPLTEEPVTVDWQPPGSIRRPLPPSVLSRERDFNWHRYAPQNSRERLKFTHEPQSASAEGTWLRLQAELPSDIVEPAGIDWDLGDGTQSDRQDLRHRYKPGAYTVRLTVRDARGMRFVEQPIFVAPPAVASEKPSPLRETR
jgi:PKD repeat protein